MQQIADWLESLAGVDPISHEGSQPANVGSQPAQT